MKLWCQQLFDYAVLISDPQMRANTHNKTKAFLDGRFENGRRDALCFPSQASSTAAWDGCPVDGYLIPTGLTLRAHLLSREVGDRLTHHLV